MVGVPVWFWVWVCACVPFVWVMGVVGVGCSGWCCFQYCVAVVWASRRVPGVLACVSWLVPGACVGWFAGGGVVGVGVGVSWLVCVAWFRMLMRVPFLFLFG